MWMREQDRELNDQIAQGNDDFNDDYNRDIRQEDRIDRKQDRLQQRQINDYDDDYNRDIRQEDRIDNQTKNIFLNQKPQYQDNYSSSSEDIIDFNKLRSPNYNQSKIQNSNFMETNAVNIKINTVSFQQGNLKNYQLIDEKQMKKEMKEQQKEVNEQQKEEKEVKKEQQKEVKQVKKEQQKVFKQQQKQEKQVKKEQQKVFKQQQKEEKQVKKEHQKQVKQYNKLTKQLQNHNEASLLVLQPSTFIQPVIQPLQKKQQFLITASQLLQSKKQPPLLLDGRIFKKSQFLSRWDERFLRIADNQIFSYETVTDFDNFNSKFSIGLPELNKMKLLSDCYRENYIFRLYYQKTTEFAANLSNYYDLPLCYAWFASILTMKFKYLTNQKITQPQLINQEIYSDFTYKKFISGYIYKRSQIRGHWEKRLVIINPTGLYSFKHTEEIKPSFIIKAEDINYIWTRFQFQNDFLIIKVKHNLVKTQFAVPMVNFMLKQNNWLFAIYRLMIQNKCNWMDKGAY